jgi:hypothetical protein
MRSLCCYIVHSDSLINHLQRRILTSAVCLVYLVLMMYSRECMAIRLILIIISTINSYLHYSIKPLPSDRLDGIRIGNCSYQALTTL